MSIDCSWRLLLLWYWMNMLIMLCLLLMMKIDMRIPAQTLSANTLPKSLTVVLWFIPIHNFSLTCRILSHMKQWCISTLLWTLQGRCPKGQTVIQNIPGRMLSEGLVVACLYFLKYLCNRIYSYLASFTIIVFVLLIDLQTDRHKSLFINLLTSCY